ncbi:MAG: ATP synthase F1 subunit delta [Acidobacteria bacterium]|nr:ATP synthase F1 subunit delta [Acidobacteriota bacterium]
MKSITVANRYARALADVVGDKDKARLEKVSSELTLLARVLEIEPSIGRFFEDPSVQPEDRQTAAGTVEKKIGAGPLTRRFIDVLIENRRLSALPTIAAVFAEIVDERLGIIPVDATTAVALSAADRKKFQSSLEKMTGHHVRLSLRVDPSLIGGARTQIGSQVYDGTVRRQLALLRERLAEAR